MINRALLLALVLGTNGFSGELLEAFGMKWDVPLAKDWAVENGVLRMLVARPQEHPRRPAQFALADTPPWQRVTIEADVMPAEKHLIVVFAYRGPAHFNYAHLSTDMASRQPVHNGIFHVYGGERVRISSERGPASFTEAERWYRVKLTHDASTGIVGVTVDGKAIPALDAVDLSLGAGRVGLGSFFNRAQFRNVKITGTPAGK